MQHRGLHARSVHANSISRHYWVMVRRVFCLCCRDDMKIETSCPFSRHGICASNILFRGSWSSDDGPDLTTPVVCRVPASGRSRACGPDPGRPQNPHDACCWLFVVGCPVACFPASSSTVNTNTSRRPARLLQLHSETSRQLGLPRYTRSKLFLLSDSFPRPRRRVIGRPHPLLMSSGDCSKHHGSRHRHL